MDDFYHHIAQAPLITQSKSLHHGIRVGVAAHGCKLNQAESDSIGRRLAEAGCTLVDPEGPADVYILNTCSVTHVADAKGRQWLRAAHRRNPRAAVIATGCYASRAHEELYKVAGATLVVNNRDKGRLLELVEGLGVLEKYGSLPAADGGSMAQPLPRPTRTRAFVKIQEGCNQFCAFCIIPYTRGRETSVPIPMVVEEVRARVEEGYKEVVLTGPQIGSYGLYPPNLESRDDPEGFSGRLHGLIEAILLKTDIIRLRISSIQPQDLTSRLLAAWGSSRLCRHVHMALQSGSDAVLKRMHRRYSTPDYERAIEMLRRRVAGIAITTDVMVGFPGESGQEFEESYRFCEKMGFAGIHVFPYSPRPGTRASGMAGQLSNEIKKERVARMSALAIDAASRFRRAFLGQSVEVLWEEQADVEGEVLSSGLSDNYLRIYTRDSVKTTSITPAILQQELHNGLIGRAPILVEGRSG